jgi:hypothetical protein
MQLLSQVYFFSYKGTKNGKLIYGNGEFWFGYKEKVDNIKDIRDLENAITKTEKIKGVTVEGNLTPLRFVERNGQSQIFYWKGEIIKEPAVPKSGTGSKPSKSINTRPGR